MQRDEDYFSIIPGGTYNCHVGAGKCRSDVLIANATGPCELGFRDGRRIIKNKWDRDFEGDCDFIWDLEDVGQRAANRTYRRGRNWREREFNRCARLGVQDQVKSYERQCLDHTSDQCFDLAQAAAEAIVLEFVCAPKETAKVPTLIDYKENCRNVAKNNCPDRIWTTMEKWCPTQADNIKPRELIILENKCGPTVNNFFKV